MPIHRLELTNQVCPHCSNHSGYLILKVIQTWDPFPGEEPSKDIVFERCSNPKCNYEVMVEDYLFGRDTPYVRPESERFTINDLRLMHGYHEIVPTTNRPRDIVRMGARSHHLVAA